MGTKEILFDELYRVKENRLYLSSDFNNYVKSTIKYNYLGLKLETKDGRENITKYSYNEFLNPSKTENADASYTIRSETYYNGYPYTFGLIPGMVAKKVLTDETGNLFDKYYDAYVGLSA